MPTTTRVVDRKTTRYERVDCFGENLTREEVALTLYALRDLISRRQLGGQPIRPDIIALYHHLKASADGSESSAPGEELGSEDLIDAFEAAEILRCTPRRVTQIHADLDGVKIGRQWVFRRRTVAEYAHGAGSGAIRRADGGRQQGPGEAGCGAVAVACSQRGEGRSLRRRRLMARRIPPQPIALAGVRVATIEHVQSEHDKLLGDTDAYDFSAQRDGSGEPRHLRAQDRASSES